MKRAAALVFALVAVFSMAFAQDAKTALTEFYKYRAELSKQVSGPEKLSIDDYRAKLKAKVEELTKGIELSKVDAKDCLDWARVFQAGSLNRQTCDFAKKYLETKPNDQDKFQAMSLMASSCNAQGEADMLAMTLMDIPVPDAASSRTLANATTGSYVDTIYEKKGLKAALSTLETVEKKLIPEDPKEYAQRMLAAEKARAAAATAGGTPAAAIAVPGGAAPKTDEEKLAAYEKQGAQSNESLAFAFQAKRAELYKEAGKKQEAVDILNKAIAGLPAGSPTLRSAKSQLAQLTLIDSIAPAITATEAYGEFKGLDALKGKVVIIDFFAHWCGPCKAAFPDMEKLYSDLHDKGLEIIGVTTYYGYYKAEKNLSRADEFARMKDFIAEYKLPWPVVFGERTNFEPYGITGIPTAAVIGRDGKVHTLHVGYSPESFKAFRAEIERLVK